MLCTVTGITNKSLRALMTGLLGTPYSMNQASYDLGRLSRNGLITRIPRRNLYALTADGLRFAIFYTKVHDRVLRPLMAGDQPQLRPRSAPPFASSMERSPAASPPHDRQQPPDQPRSALRAYIPGLKTQDPCQSPSSQARLADADSDIYLRKCETGCRCQSRPGRAFATVGLRKPAVAGL